MVFETLQTITRSIGDHADRAAVLALSRERAARWTYRALSEHVRRLAAGLADAGIERSEPVTLFAPNRPEWIGAALAILDLRGVLVLIDAQARGDELAHYLNDSGSRHVFTVRTHADRLAVSTPPAGRCAAST